MQTLKTAFNHAGLIYTAYDGWYWFLLLWLWLILIDEYRRERCRRQAILARKPKFPRW